MQWSKRRLSSRRRRLSMVKAPAATKELSFSNGQKSDHGEASLSVAVGVVRQCSMAMVVLWSSDTPARTLRAVRPCRRRCRAKQAKQGHPKLCELSQEVKDCTPRHNVPSSVTHSNDGSGPLRCRHLMYPAGEGGHPTHPMCQPTCHPMCHPGEGGHPA